MNFIYFLIRCAMSYRQFASAPMKDVLVMRHIAPCGDVPVLTVLMARDRAAWVVGEVVDGVRDRLEGAGVIEVMVREDRGTV